MFVAVVLESASAFSVSSSSLNLGDPWFPPLKNRGDNPLARCPQPLVSHQTLTSLRAKGLICPYRLASGGCSVNVY